MTPGVPASRQRHSARRGLLSAAVAAACLALGPGAQAEIRAVESAAGGVRVEWTRQDGPPWLAGWQVERQEPDGRGVRVTAARLDPGLLDSPSTVYCVQDALASARAGDAVAYRLVVVDPELQEQPGSFVTVVVEPEGVSAAAETRPKPVRVPRATADAGPGAAGARLRLAVTNAGLFRVTAAQVAAGLATLNEAQAVQAIRETNLALSCGGVPVAWQAEPGGTGLVFFAEAVFDTYDHRGLYWLEPGPGLAMAAANRATADTLADPWFWETVRVEQNLHFQPYLPGEAGDDYWVWAGQQVTAPSTSWSWNTTVPLTDLHPGQKQGTVTAYLAGAYDGPAPLDNRTRLFAAGQLLNDQRWAGDARLAQPGLATNLTGSSVSVAVEIRRETDVTTTTVLIDAVAVRYARRMRALNQQLLFRPEPGAAVATVRGFTSPDIRVFDVTDPFQPVAMAATVASEGAEWRASWSVTPADPGRFLAVAATAVPAEIAGVADGGWTRAQTGAAHVVIAPRALTNAAAALVAHRIRNGLDSILVPVEDLYDAFAFGRRDPRAIPRFLQQAATNWTVSPQSVCLAGDGHLDYHDYHGQAATRPNHIPPLLERIPYDASPTGNRVTLGLDNPLVDLDGDDMPDLAVGRLPAQTSAALTRMINRIATYEAADAWKNKVLLVADRDAENAFRLAMDRMAGEVPAGMSVQRLNHAAATPVETMRTNFIQAFNAGPALAVYFGHANNIGISSPYFFEHSYVRSYMTALNNAARTPLLLAGTCMLNDFAPPHPDNRCIGKGLLDTAPGGAVAVWASAAEANLSIAETTTGAIFNDLFADHDGRLGDLLLPALDLLAASASPWTVRSSVLLGDPGTRIRTHLGPPVPAIETSVAQVDVSEDGTATFGVRLSAAPVAATTVAVARVAGDADLRVASGAHLVFAPANYAIYQTVTIAADADADAVNGSATIQCTAAECTAAQVAAYERESTGPAYAAQINCGGGALPGGWTADTGFSSGGVGATASSVANATLAPMALYQTDRNAASFRYSLAAAPNGSYQVRLHFNEMLARGAGQRVFHVNIEGVRVLSNLDIYAITGGRLRALVRTFDVTVSDGNGLQLDFTRVTGYAQVCGIEIESLGPPPAAVVANPAAVTVPEGGNATFGVHLNTAPAGSTTVTVVRASGDGDIGVSGGASLVFTADNYGTDQTVTLAAGEDGDTDNGTATIQCTTPAYTAAEVTATEQDNDVPPYPGKINCGGGALSGGWAADTGFAGGAAGATASAVANATLAPMALYQKDRNAPSFRYSLATVPNGTYQVRLHFCEMLAKSSGQRVFHVAAEGVRVLSSLDIYAAAGGRLRALARTFNVTISDGNGLQLDFTRVAGYAQVCGIEIESLGPPPAAVVASTAAVTVAEGGNATFGLHLNTAPAGSTTVTVVRASGDGDISVSGGASLVFTAANYGIDQTVAVAAGEDGDTDNGTATIQCSAPGHAAAEVAATEQDNDVPPYPGMVNCGGGALAGGWAADTGFAGGAVGATASAVANATLAPVALYQSDRNGASFRYSLATVPNGTYQVRLHFCEMLARGAGQRVFHVEAEGVRVLSSLDIYAAAGGRLRALVRTLTVTVSDGNGLQLDFTRVAGYAQVCGIEIAPAGAGSARAAARTMAGRTAVVALEPDEVLTSEDSQTPDAGWAAVDGDPETVWQAAGSSGSWICLGYAQSVEVRQVAVQFAGDSPPGLLMLASEDARDWFELEPELEQGPVHLNYLWFLFPAAPLEPSPAVRNIVINGLAEK